MDVPVSDCGAPSASIPGEENTLQSGKKLGRSTANNSSLRRSNHQTSTVNSSPKDDAVSEAAVGEVSTILDEAPLDGTAKKSFGGIVTTHANTKASSPSASAVVGGGSASTAAPAKRVVQKWTEGEKADFLKYFSVRVPALRCSLCYV
uniref:Uncharacterized protein n=1 Tax=Hyaloperonospora arabidopsidis (strain Emoy2) TaxID=559515 RepID=M4C4Q7_HYAAE